jgi:hypothetical protein
MAGGRKRETETETGSQREREREREREGERERVRGRERESERDQERVSTCIEDCVYQLLRLTKKFPIHIAEYKYITSIHAPRYLKKGLRAPVQKASQQKISVSRKPFFTAHGFVPSPIGKKF